MKKFLAYLFVAIVGFLVVGITNPKVLKNPRSLVYYSACDTPQPYKIGSIDPRFGITAEKLQEDITKAGDVWSAEWGKPLFVWDPAAKLSINMIYDRRQSLNQHIGELENKLDQDKTTVSNNIAEFEKRSAEFKAKVDDLNKQIAYWNERGGAPKDEYDKLKQQQQDLKNEAETLNDMAKTLNKSTYAFNSQVSELNSTVVDFNQALSERPEQGLYRSLENTIDIYLTSSNPELIHTLAHEMGHALGMDHVEDSLSIMYKSTNQITTASVEDSAELSFACRERPVTEKFKKILQEYMYRLQASRS